MCWNSPRAATPRQGDVCGCSESIEIDREMKARVSLSLKGIGASHFTEDEVRAILAGGIKFMPSIIVFTMYASMIRCFHHLVFGGISISIKIIIIVVLFVMAVGLFQCCSPFSSGNAISNREWLGRYK